MAVKRGGAGAVIQGRLCVRAIKVIKISKESE